MHQINRHQLNNLETHASNVLYFAKSANTNDSHLHGNANEQLHLYAWIKRHAQDIIKILIFEIDTAI